MYQQLRKQFVDFFTKRRHTHLPSSSLVPHNDPSLLFVNSGMVQFKEVFTGAEQRICPSAVTVQKCLRAGGKHNDLDNVGYTARHHTFFEMLGNFSFRDYFKSEAIEFAWEFLTKELCLPKDRLYVTVYHTDDEALNIWRRVANLSADRILRIDTNDNFWSMGDTGPCGPCSEIYYDYGDGDVSDIPKLIADGSDQCVEIWNLVFMQMCQTKDDLKTLERPSIDTGMGLERMVAVLEGVRDNYNTSLFLDIINGICSVYGAADANRVACRVVADHMRAISFLISDGVLPSNEGRGYVLRRIMRRAMRYLHQINAKEAKMHELVAIVESAMGEAYPELSCSRSLIENTIKCEEMGFKDTLDRGLSLLNMEVDCLGSGKVFPGEMAFKLYDTYGFPVDLTADTLCRMGLSLDMQGFDQAMELQKERAKAAWQGSGDNAHEKVWFTIKRQMGSLEQFKGYEFDQLESKVLFILDADSNILNQLDVNNEGWLVTQATPFYPEGGGQVGDIGTITTAGMMAQVLDTQKFAGDVVAHKVRIMQGSVHLGVDVLLSINTDYRKSCARHHSATHILHHVLRNVLGDHIVQKGSRVNAENLHFDFNYQQGLDKDHLIDIERKVNEIIMKNLPVAIRSMDKDMASSENALGLFGEKYGEVVRVVDIGPSKELCGGTHVKATGEIGLFRITGERSIGCGIRRITAASGLALLEHIYDAEQAHLKAVQLLKDKVRISEAEANKKLGDLSKLLLSESIKASKDGICYFCMEEFPLAVGRKFYKEMLPSMGGDIAVFIAKSRKNERYSWIIASGPDARCKAVDLAARIIELAGEQMPAGGYSDNLISFGSRSCLQHAEVLKLLGAQ